MQDATRAPVSTSAQILRPLLAAATREDLAHAARALGVDPEELAGPERLVGLRHPFSFWRDLSGMAGDPSFAMHAGMRMDHGDLGVLGYILLTSASFRDSLGRGAPLLSLIDELLEYRLTEDGDRAALSLLYDGEPMVLPPPVSEFSLAAVVSLVRKGVGQDFTPLEVRFRHPPPADPSPHVRLFGCPVVFSAPCNELVFASHHLDRPALRHDARLCAILSATATLRVESLRADRTPLDDIERAYRHALRQGDCALDEVAARLAISGRTLQRHLKKIGTSHLRMLEGARRSLALRWATDPGRSADDIAAALRFPTPLHFARAFRRWTGASLAEYRARKRAPAPTRLLTG